MFSLKASTGSYAAPVDIYFALSAGGQVYLFDEFGTAANFADILELIPWVRNEKAGTVVDVIPGFEWAQLPDGVYNLYLMALPYNATTLDNSYLWWTSIVKDQHKIMADPSCLELSQAKTAQTVKLFNPSADRTVTISGVSSGTTSFSATNACNGIALLPNGDCTFDVTFNGGTGTVNDQLTIDYQSVSGDISGAAVPDTLTVPVTGIGSDATTECSYTLSAASGVQQPDGSVSLSIPVSASKPGCSPAVNEQASWVSSSTGCEQGNICFTVSAPAAGQWRQTDIQIADQYIGIEQVSSGTCSYTFILPSRFPAAGGDGTLTVVTGTGCAWEVDDFNLSLPSFPSGGTSGTGNKSVVFRVSANTQADERPQSIYMITPAVAGNPAELAIIQNGMQGGTTTKCTYSISPSDMFYDLQGGSGQLAVTVAGESCIWMARSNNKDWLRLTGDKLGVQSGVVAYTVLPDTGENPQTTTGTISIADKIFTVTRGASAPCKYTVTAPTSQVPVGGASYSINISATPNSGCAPWTAKSDKDWIVITPGTGTGTGTARYTVKANTGSTTGTNPLCAVIPQLCYAKAQPRSGTITVATGSTTLKQITVSQAGSDGGSTPPPPPPPPPSCKPTYSPSSANYSYAGGSGTITVTAGSTCKWSVNVGMSSWVDISEVSSTTGKSTTSGTGNGTIKYTVYSNDTSSKRSEIISIAGMSFDVNQEAGSACTYNLYPLNADSPSIPGDYFDAAGGYGIIKAKVKTGTNCVWTAGTTADWIVLNSADQHSGDGQLNYKVKRLPADMTTRSGSITIGTQSFKVVQSVACSVVLSAEPDPLAASGETRTVTVTTTPATGCNWAATSADAWLKLTDATGAAVDYILGSGSGSVNYKIDATTDMVKGRGSALAIGGRTHIVMQHKAPDPAKTTAADIEPPVVYIPWKYLPKDSSGTSLQVPLTGSTGDSFRFGVTVDSGCAGLDKQWAVRNDTSVTLKGDQLTKSVSSNPNKPTGDVSFTVAPNPGTVDRKGSIDFVDPGSCQKADGSTIYLSARGDTSFAITQKPCAYSLSASSQQAPATGGSYSVRVTADTGCPWTASSNDSWITIDSGASGSGNGTVAYTVAANSGTTSRTGSLTIAGQTLTVTQSGQSSGSEIIYQPNSNPYNVSNPARKTTNISLPNWGRSAMFYELKIDIPANAQCNLQANLALEMLYPFDNNFYISDTKFTTYEDAWRAYFTGLCKNGPDDIDPKTGFCKNGYNFAKKTTFQTSTGVTANIYANNDPSYESNSIFWGKVNGGSTYYVMIVGESPEGAGVWRFTIGCY